MTAPKHIRAPRAAGFTLLELMVALAVGAIAITSVYAIGAASARHFGEQQRVSNAQTALRMAMNQIKRDLARAGYMASPNAALAGETCMTTLTPVALAYQENPDAALVDLNNGEHDPHGEGGVQGDRLILTGNYVTRDEYLIAGLNAGGTAAYLQSDWHAFRRSFTNWWADPPDPTAINTAAVAEVFRTNRWMRLQNQDGFKFFVAITSAGMDAGGSGQVQVNFSFNGAGLPVTSPCVGGLMSGAKVAPLSMIQYRLSNAGTSQVAGDNIQLLREELDPNNPATLLSGGTTQNSQQAILDYVVNFDVDFVLDTRNRAVTGSTPCLTFYDDGAAANAPACSAGGSVATNPEFVRSVVVTLSTRTDEQDPRFPWLVRTAGQPLSRYRFDPQRDGAARVRTLRAEILVPTLAHENL